MKRKNICIVLLIFFISISEVYSQVGIDSLKNQKTFQTNSLQFQVSGLLSVRQPGRRSTKPSNSSWLKGFQGALLSYKYHISDKHAFRFGLSITVNNDDQEEIYKRYYNYLPNFERTLVRTKNSGGKIHYYSISASYLCYLNPKNDIKFYTGIGPYVGYSKKNSMDEQNIDERYERITNSTYRSYILGINAIYGLEWFFANNVSIVAEYGFSLYYYYDTSDYTFKRIFSTDYNISGHNYLNESVEKGWRFHSSSVKLGLSVYF